MQRTKELFQELYQAMKPDEELKQLEREYYYELSQSRKPKTKKK